MILGTHEKQPWEVKDYDIDFGQWMAPSDTLQTLSAEVSPSGLVVGDPVNNDPLVKLWVSSGVDGIKYKVTLKATTTDGRKEESEFYVKVKEH